ncbi:MAG: MFS transporter [Syntrophorhabdales bacterium]|jgi:FSR family fosmidomycin resistance protein-like MFS transporter
MSAKMNLKLILVLSASHLFMDVTGSALPAIMPFFKAALSLNYAQIGSVIMVSNVTSSIIQPCFGYFSDRMQIRWLLPVSVFLTYGGFSLVGLAPSYGLLLTLVIFNGVGVAVYHPESFKITHHFTGSRMATGMSLFQVGGNFGMAFGPLLVTYAMQMAGLRGTLLFLVPGIVMLGILLCFLRELTMPFKGEKKAGVKPAVAISTPIKHPWRSMGFLVGAVAMRSWAHMGLITFAPFYYIAILKGDPISAGRLVFAFLIGGALGTLSGGLVADRIGHKSFVCLSLLGSIPLLYLFLEVSGMWVFIVLFFVGFVLISSFSVTVVMGQTILRDRLGMASGLMLGFVIGIGGVGAGLLGLVADARGILFVLRLIVIMPAVGLIPLLMMSYPARRPELAPQGG